MKKTDNKNNALQWRSFDLHLHTPASDDFQQPETTYLDILQRAEARSLDIIAFTDHNSVAGYKQMLDHLDQLEFLEKSNRLLKEEKAELMEYRRLLKKILVLPGFEFTATLGFHILAIFPPSKPLMEIEHLLLSMNVPVEALGSGITNAGATVDVLTAYRLINQAGGLVIAAHANSSNGVAMKGLGFGGQTRIAFTQDPNLHALEVTDLDIHSSKSTAAFFNGTKPEYPRRMHCIQGSDSHRLTADPVKKKNLGVGDRPTEALLSDVSFDALMELFQSMDFSRTRPRRMKEEPAFDFIQAAREQGPNIVQDFHESCAIKGGKEYAILADICAFANTNGGTLYIGIPSDPQKPVVGIPNPSQSLQQLEKDINTRISPPLQCSLTLSDYQGKKILKIIVPESNDPPCALDDYKIYVRNENETSLAVRDEIVRLVLRQRENLPVKIEPPAPVAEAEAYPAVPAQVELDSDPRTGVEIVSVEERKGLKYYQLRDLRNGNIIRNVTRSSARKLWHHAISRYEEIMSKNEEESKKAVWHGNRTIIRKTFAGKMPVYELAEKKDGKTRYFFGVTQDGISSAWKDIVGEED